MKCICTLLFCLWKEVASESSVLSFSVPTFQSLPEEILSKLADVLEEVIVLVLKLCEMGHSPAPQCDDESHTAETF